MADESRDRYLAALDELLPMPPARRAEIIEEISAHLDDAVADSIERGLVIERAEADAQARLGAPGQLARELARPTQTLWQLLPAAGAGLRTGIGNGLYGYLLGALVSYVAFIAIAGLGMLVGRLLGSGWSLTLIGEGWNSLFTATAVAMGLYYAGRAMPEKVSLASGRMLSDVRPWVVWVVGTIAFVAMTFVIDAPHNWASAIAFAVAPAAFALGAYRPRLMPRRVKVSGVIVVGLFLIVPLVGLLTARTGGGATEGGPPTAVDGPIDRGLAVVGPLWTDDQPVEGTLFTSWNATAAADGAKRYDWELANGTSLAGFRDLRAEAWRLEPNGGLRLDPAFDEPFAVATVERSGSTLSAVLDSTNEPGVSYWELILTGVAPDGERYVLDSDLGQLSTFTGSVWDWVAAVTADR